MNRTTRIVSLLLAFGIFAVCSLILVSHHVGASTGTSMEATFRDDLTIPDRIRSDGGGPYINGQQSVSAIIDGQGDFDLNTSSKGAHTRSLFVDLTSPTSSSATPPFTTAFVDAFLSTGGGGLPQMSVGSVKVMHLQIDLPNYYFLDFNPSAQPGSSTVTVTRTASDTWTIEASANSIAELRMVTTSHGKTTTTNEGLFYMPFKITAQLH